MPGIILILFFVAYLVIFFPLEQKEKKEEEKSPKYAAQMKKPTPGHSGVDFFEFLISLCTRPASAGSGLRA